MMIAVPFDTLAWLIKRAQDNVSDDTAQAVIDDLVDEIGERRYEGAHVSNEDAHRALSEFAHDRRRLYPARDTLRSLRSQVSVPEATDLDVALDLIEERIQS